VQLKDIFKKKQSENFAKGVLFLQDHALATKKKLAYMGFE
jgi:hypothetical protein